MMRPQPSSRSPSLRPVPPELSVDRKSTRLNSSHSSISYAVFCLKNPATPEIYTLSLHDALPIFGRGAGASLEVAPSFVGFQRTETGLGSCLLRAPTLPYLEDDASAAEFPEPVPATGATGAVRRSEEHTSELQSQFHLVCRLLLEKSGDTRDLHSFPTRRSSDLWSRCWCVARSSSLFRRLPENRNRLGLVFIKSADPSLPGG